MNKWLSITGIIFVIGLIFGGQYLQEKGSKWLLGSGGDFTLQSVNGPVSLKQFKGNVVAVYFGYMSCPDICPTSLWNLTSAIKLLTPEQANKVQGIFISLDTERDYPEAMDLFVKGFNKKFIGLTDTQEIVDKVARQYGVVYQKVKLKDSAMGYVLDHSSIIYLIDKQGSIQYRVPHNTAPEKIKEELLKLIKKD